MQTACRLSAENIRVRTSPALSAMFQRTTIMEPFDRAGLA